MTKQHKERLWNRRAGRGVPVGRTVIRQGGGFKRVAEALGAWQRAGGNPWVIAADLRHYNQFAGPEDRRCEALLGLPVWVD
jgi:hypothetical protein